MLRNGVVFNLIEETKAKMLMYQMSFRWYDGTTEAKRLVGIAPSFRLDTAT